MNDEKEKIKFFNKYYLLILLIVILFSFIYSVNNFSVCKGVIELNEELLREECDVTIDEYYAILTIDRDFCPEVQEFEGTECNYRLIILFILSILVIYNMLYIVIFLILQQKKQTGNIQKNQEKSEDDTKNQEIQKNQEKENEIKPDVKTKTNEDKEKK